MKSTFVALCCYGHTNISSCFYLHLTAVNDVAFFFLLFAAVSSLCEGSCKVVNHIGQGLCNVLDVAIGALKVTEKATAWVGRAIDFVLTKLFRVYR